jgi:hypothetical protein
MDQYSTTWSSTPSSSQAASSSLSSIPPFQHQSHITEEVYDGVGNYLNNDSDPDRQAARKRIEEEDRTSSPEWCQLYLSVPLGSLPSVEDCNNLAPPLLKILAIIPIREVLHNPEPNTPVSRAKKSKKPAPAKAPTLRPNSATLFCYRKVNDKFYCQLPRIAHGVEMACDHTAGVSHGTGVRSNHIISQHPGILDAINYFQNQQKIAIETRQQSNPQSSKRSKKSSTMADGTVPLWDEIRQDAAINHLMRLVAVEGVSFSVATSKSLKALCNLLNPSFQFPCTATLKDRLRKTVESRKRQTVNYIHANVVRGALTADAWTSGHNKRKYLGITFHYMTREYRLSTVVIGMERLLAVKVTAEILESAINKFAIFNSPVSIIFCFFLKEFSF